MTAPLMISVSGIRGIVGESLTADQIQRFAAAYARCLNIKKVVIGRDTRSSGLAFEHILVGTLMSCGCDVVRLGVCPTPTVGMAVLAHQAGGGIVITASHNPAQWNALKLMNQDGLFFSEAQGQKLLDYFERQDFPYQESEAFGQEYIYSQAGDDHIQKLLAKLDVDLIRSKQFTVALDSVNGAGSVITPQFLEQLGCRVVAVHCDVEQPFPRQPEPTQDNLKETLAWVKGLDCDIAFVQDPDADRLAVINSDGVYVGEEMTLALALESVLSSCQEDTTVVANVSSTLFLDEIAQQHHARVVRTKVGEAHVVQGMLDNKAVIGGEGNGGVIYAPTHLGRDSLAGIGLILQLMAQREQSLQEIMQDWPQLRMVKHKISMTKQEFQAKQMFLAQVFIGAEESKLDGLKYTWPDRWVQVRASNTEPIVRIFSEAATFEDAQALIDQAVLALSM